MQYCFFFIGIQTFEIVVRNLQCEYIERNEKKNCNASKNTFFLILSNLNLFLLYIVGSTIAKSNDSFFRVIYGIFEKCQRQRIEVFIFVSLENKTFVLKTK